jgi:hypothetical protein
MGEHTPEKSGTTSLSRSPGTDTSSKPPPPADDLPADHGDGACWARRVCAECGRLNDSEQPATCQTCGAEFD